MTGIGTTLTPGPVVVAVDDTGRPAASNTVLPVRVYVAVTPSTGPVADSVTDSGAP